MFGPGGSFFVGWSAELRMCADVGLSAELRMYVDVA